MNIVSHLSKSLGVAVVFACAVNVAAASELRRIDCHQAGDGFNDFTLDVTDATHAILTVDTFHTPVLPILKAPPLAGEARLVRFYLKSDTGFNLSQRDKYLASFIATPEKIELLDPEQQLLGVADASQIIDVRLDSIHGQSNQSTVLTDFEAYLYQIEVSAKAPFRHIVGLHWLSPSVDICQAL
jgi:hypothetical protein